MLVAPAKALMNHNGNRGPSFHNSLQEGILPLTINA